MSRYARFPVERIDLKSIELRGHDLSGQTCLPLACEESASDFPGIRQVSRAILSARENGRPVILMMGGHLIKRGLSRFIIDLVERSIVTHVASNGSAIIHDFELSTIGGTSENVAKWISAGQFGLWQETSRINDIIQEAARTGEGLGEALGRVIQQADSPYKHLSILAACWRNEIPFTAHVTIGGDIIHSHANCNGAALGTAAYEDFLIFANSILSLEGGVFLNIGSAITGPEVYLKALSMARNVVHQEKARISRFTTAVFDMVRLGSDWKKGPPGKNHPLYYFRPWKTILHRTVADGGVSHYVQGEFASTIPLLWDALTGRGEMHTEFPNESVLMDDAYACWSAGERCNDDSLAARLQQWRNEGRTISFTNGCFDILHVGHLKLLLDAKQRGDALVVGVNSDRSAKRLKGPNRPINTEEDRCCLLSSLASVDLVCLFDEDTPESLIETIRPQYLVKGDEYLEAEIPGSEFVKSYNGEVVRVPMVPQRSTSGIISSVNNMTCEKTA